MDAELERLGVLVDALLALARSESATAPAPADVAAAADEAVQRWGALADEHGVRLVLDLAGPATARCVAGGVEQILDNLVDNALGVAPRGTSIDVAVRAELDVVTLSVRDHGPGMDEAERARATDRFWRSAGAPPGGTGLGLAIVAELARSSGGSVELLQPAEGQGLLVEVRLQRTS